LETRSRKSDERRQRSSFDSGFEELKQRVLVQ